MGMDIHMALVKNNEYVKENIFDGRNSDWFNNMMGNGWDDLYDKLPINYGLSDQTPVEYEEKYKDWCFDYHYVNVKNFKEWFQKYRPDIDAGWVSTYDKWRIEKKGYIPKDILHYLPEDANPADMHFVEVINPYDCSAWLFTYLVENDIEDDVDIVYCFDN